MEAGRTQSTRAAATARSEPMAKAMRGELSRDGLVMVWLVVKWVGGRRGGVLSRKGGIRTALEASSSSAVLRVVRALSRMLKTRLLVHAKQANVQRSDRLYAKSVIGIQ